MRHQDIGNFTVSESALQAPFPEPDFWVPDLDPGRAAVLTVPAHPPYHKAVREKLIRLLEAAGQHDTRVASESLDLEESQLQHEDFPAGWADQILACGIVKKMVLTGSPETAEPADEALARNALANQAALTLADFLRSVEDHREPLAR